MQINFTEKPNAIKLQKFGFIYEALNAGGGRWVFSLAENELQKNALVEGLKSEGFKFEYMKEGVVYNQDS